MDLRRSLLAHAWLQTMLWVVIAVAANHLASLWFTRVDLTADQRYSLSPAARKVVSRLEKPLVARAYFTGDLQVPYHNHEQAVREKLEELRAYSNGRMEIRFVDPTGDKEAAEEAQRFGIQPIPYKYKSWEGEELRQVYMGVSFVYGDAQATADALASLETLEYELVRAILAITTKREDRKAVAFLQGNGEPDFAQVPSSSPLGQLRDQLGQSYDLLTVTLGGDEPVPEAVDALLVVGPQNALPDRTQYQIDQFVMRGGRVGFFLGSTRADFRSWRALDVRHDLNALVGHYGVRLERDAVIDRKHNDKMPQPVQVGSTRRMIALPHPLIPVSTNLDRSSTIVRRLERVVLPFTSTLTVPEDLPPGVEADVLIRTMPTSTAAEGLDDVTGEALRTPLANERQGPFPVAVALSGRFESFFAQRPIPPPAGRDEAPEEPASKLVDSEATRMVIVSSADMIANNLPFVHNTVDWLLEDTALIDIRPDEVTIAEFTPPPAETVLRWKLGIVGGPLLVLLGVGATVFTAGRRRA